MTDQLAYPLRFQNGMPVLVEQDSDEEIAQCIRVILSYPIGSCIDLPQFGRPDPLFTQDGIDPQDLEDAVDEWEPRATSAVSRTALIDDTIDELRLDVTPRR